jgi:hypothetical protein
VLRSVGLYFRLGKRSVSIRQSAKCSTLLHRQKATERVVDYSLGSIVAVATLSRAVTRLYRGSIVKIQYLCVYDLSRFLKDLTSQYFSDMLMRERYIDCPRLPRKPTIGHSTGESCVPRVPIAEIEELNMT